jgi:integrase
VMGRKVELSSRAVAAWSGTGRICCGPNLYLQRRLVEIKDPESGEVRYEPGPRSWLFRYLNPQGREVWMGLGSYGDLSTVAAKARAEDLRSARRHGRDPLAERRANAAPRPARMTFKQVADLFMLAHQASWKNAKHVGQWSITLATYVYPTLGALPVADVDTDVVLQCLQAIWHDKPETAARVRGRVEAILSFAAARGWRTGDSNPARWRGHLDQLLPRANRVRAVVHHPAMPWREVPQLYAELRERPEMAALALRLVVLCASRSGEVIGASPAEFDLPGATWTVPPQRMKMGLEFRVALSKEAIAVIDAAEQVRTTPSYQFSGRDGPLASAAMWKLLQAVRAGEGLTVHGFRSSFRTWAQDNGVATEIAEAALAHTVGPYQRSDLLLQRKRVMQRWAHFVAGPVTVAGKVENLEAARQRRATAASSR